MSKTATLPVEAPRPQGIKILPPRLKARLEKFKAEMPPWYPVFDRVFVYPLQFSEEKTESGLYIPQSLNKDVNVGLGLIVGAGMKAIEELYGHGMSIGDIVLTARLSPWERKFISRTTKEPHTVLILRASECVASMDLLDAFEKGDLCMEMTPDGRVQLNDNGDARMRNDPAFNADAI